MTHPESVILAFEACDRLVKQNQDLINMTKKLLIVIDRLEGDKKALAVDIHRKNCVDLWSASMSAELDYGIACAHFVKETYE